MDIVLLILLYFVIIVALVHIGKECGGETEYFCKGVFLVLVVPLYVFWPIFKLFNIIGKYACKKGWM